ncbi:site-specific integrase [Lactobacillus crispatus]|uniref:site-specific integrase n=1 Tax=Lactobacillus crispatus TaxID=47770 RepID=UPI0001B29DFB|nr:site-specific integrase [Lactobacillus crispatus]EEU18668.1 site-specific recombinase, phage integrase family [Lactobacillus crispatus 125-2-CHN]
MKTRYPNVYQDKNGKYFYQIFVGTDANGKKKLKKGRRDALKHPFSSAYQAYKEAQRVQALYANVSADNISYASFMKDRYLPKYRGDVEASTYDTHNLMMLKGVDFLGEIKLKDIKVIDCEKYRTWLLTDSGFSRNYASVIYTAFRQSLDYAVEIGLIASNPSLKTKSIPKGRNIENYWTMPEFEKVLASINTDTFYEELIYVTFLFYYRIGCRVNEGFALRWSDIDLINGKVRFINNLHYSSKLNYELVPYLKNDASRRTVTIDAELLEVLKKWKKEQAKYNIHDFVFSCDNCPLNKSTLSVWLKRYSKLAGVSRINGRGLRHSNASYLIAELGADVLTVSHRLGHKTPMTTLKYYAHMFSNNDIELASKMEGSMNIKPAQHSKVQFNGNQHIKGNSITGMPKVCQNKKKTA